MKLSIDDWRERSYCATQCSRLCRLILADARPARNSALLVSLCSVRVPLVTSDSLEALGTIGDKVTPRGTR